MKIHYILDATEDGDNLVLAHGQALEMLMLLQSLDADLRREAKYGEGAPAAAAEKWREALFRKMEEFNVGLGL